MVVGDDHRITGRNDVIQVNEIRQRQHDRPENQRNDDASDTLPVKIPELRAYGKQQHPHHHHEQRDAGPDETTGEYPGVKMLPGRHRTGTTNGSQQCDKTTRKQATTRSRSIQPICSLPCISISKRIFENTIKNHAIARSRRCFRSRPCTTKNIYKINKSSDNIRHPTPDFAGLTEIQRFPSETFPAPVSKSEDSGWYADHIRIGRYFTGQGFAFYLTLGIFAPKFGNGICLEPPPFQAS